MANRDRAVRALCAYGEELYDGGDEKVVFKTVSKQKVASRRNSVYTLSRY